MPPTLAEVVDDEQDHSVIACLELDQEAALIELEGSQQSQRLSLLLAPDQQIISQRWSQSIPDSRQSHISFSRRTRTSDVLPESGPSEIATTASLRRGRARRRFHGKPTFSNHIASNICFSWFDLSGFMELTLSLIYFLSYLKKTVLAKKTIGMNSTSISGRYKTAQSFHSTGGVLVKIS